MTCWHFFVEHLRKLRNTISPQYAERTTSANCGTYDLHNCGVRPLQFAGAEKCPSRLPYLLIPNKIMEFFNHKWEMKSIDMC